MTQTLILMRHAKSSWADPERDDFDRPLNGRGRASATAVAKWLAEAGHLPEEALVSGARRTVETWSQMAPHLPATATMRSNPALYHADAETVLRVLKGAEASPLLLIGHNPGLGDFARKIVAKPPDHARFADYPTGSTTIIEFDADAWADIDWGQGRVTGFATPRELPGVPGTSAPGSG